MSMCTLTLQQWEASMVNPNPTICVQKCTETLTPMCCSESMETTNSGLLDPSREQTVNVDSGLINGELIGDQSVPI